VRLSKPGYANKISVSQGTKGPIARYGPGPMHSNTPRPPICEACGQVTALVRAEPHPKFANMLQRVFVCRCGTSTSDIVAETTRRPVLSGQSPIASTQKATTAIQGA